MHREVAGVAAASELGRLALEAVVQALPDAVPGSGLERAFSFGDARPRAALVALVVRTAFLLAADARGLLRGALGEGVRARFEAAPADWPFGAAAFESAFAAARLALAACSEDSESFGPDELGAVYEGMLATGVVLARVPSAVLAVPRRAGGVLVEELVDATRLTRTERRRATLVPAGRVALVHSVERRRSGSHYTPRALSERVVAGTLTPLLDPEPTSAAVLALRVADPSLGTGAFLLAACRFLAAKLGAAEGRGNGDGTATNGDATRVNGDATRVNGDATRVNGDARRALRRVASQCLLGVDRDELAVETARHALWLAVGDPELPLSFLDERLCVGDALVGAPTNAAIPRELSAQAFDWDHAFPEVMAHGGFDAFVGNPPWVSYAGRAAQPLSAAVRSVYSRYEAFHGYRNLQGLFVERATRLLRAGGRLGLVLPSSMSELAGYAPTRKAHDRHAVADAALPDLGAAEFDGVFQPCMVLVSTRRPEPLTTVVSAAWPVERPDLDDGARALLDKLARSPLPPHLFGERGLQSSGEDTQHLVAVADARHSVPLRAGGDVEAFALRVPSAHADPAWFGRRLRTAEEWRRVRLVVRQTARVPVAALSDGAAFRNSLLAGFEDADYPAAFLVAYLNSTPIRWLHYMRHRDARQGMPQLKIAHLRATPAPPVPTVVSALAVLGARFSASGRGMGVSEQAELDALVENAFGLDAEERRRLADFRGAVADARSRA